MFKFFDEYTIRPKIKKMFLIVNSSAELLYYQIWKFDHMISYIDFFNIMIYDYVDFVNIIITYQINLYSLFINNIQSILFFTNAAVRNYIKTDVSTHKISLNMFFYERAYQQTNDIKKSFHDVDEGFFEIKIWNYKMLFQSNVI